MQITLKNYKKKHYWPQIKGQVVRLAANKAQVVRLAANKAQVVRLAANKARPQVCQIFLQIIIAQASGLLYNIFVCKKKIANKINSM